MFQTIAEMKMFVSQLQIRKISCVALIVHKNLQQLFSARQPGTQWGNAVGAIWDGGNNAGTAPDKGEQQQNE